MADKVILYSYFRSSCSWRVRIALAFKGIKYEYEPVNLLQGENLSDKYKVINPFGQLPCLMIDGLSLLQSLPIIEYLDERNPDPPLLPKDLVGKTKVRILSEVINSGIQPLQNLAVLKQVGNEKKVEWAAHFITKGFTALESMLQECAGKYCYGDTVTMADICLVPQVFGAKRFKVDMSQFPTISRVHAALESLPEFKVADSGRQPDTPEDLKIE